MNTSLFRQRQISKIGGRHEHWYVAELCKLCLQTGIGKAGNNLLIQPFDNLGGRVLGRADPQPCGRRVTGLEIPNRRDVRQKFRARRRRHRERPQFA